MVLNLLYLEKGSFQDILGGFQLPILPLGIIKFKRKFTDTTSEMLSKSKLGTSKKSRNWQENTTSQCISESSSGPKTGVGIACIVLWYM